MVELIFYGLVLGSIIALGSIGLTLVFGILKFANFAHGDLMTGGAYLAFFFVNSVFSWIDLPETVFGTTSFGIRMILAILLSGILVAALSIGIDQWVYKKIRRTKGSAILKAISALGISFILRMLVYIIWGSDSLDYYPGKLRPAIRLPLGIKIRPDQIIILIIVVLLVTGLHLFLKYTRTGKAMRATADNIALAGISGINTERITIWTWGIGGFLASVAGILYGIDVRLNPEMGWAFLLPMFAAAILGGIGNMYGALLGGLVIGVVQQLSTSFLKPTYKPAVAFLILIIILIIRPQGIFGGKKQ